MYSNYINSQSSGSHTASTDRQVEDALGLLQHLGKDDLQTLLDDPAKLDDLIKDATQGNRNEKETLLASNKSLAEFNLSLQPKLDDLKRRVATGYEEINTKKTDLGKDKAQLDSLVGEQSLDTMLALLQTEAAKSEEDSEQMAEDFCDNKLTLEEFVSKYITMRTVAHTRRVKVEKMTELLRNLHAQNHPTLHRQQNPQPSSRVPYPVGPPTGGASGPPPYPTNASFKMPEPSNYYGR